MDGGIPFREKLERRSQALKDLTPAFEVIGKEAVRMTRQAFATETAPDGTRWAPLAPSTIKARMRQLQPDSKGKRRDKGGRFNAGTIRKLDATGRLKRAALKIQVSMAGVQWFIPRYGRAHAKGTARMPRREFSPFEYRPGGWAMSPELLGYTLRILGKHARGEPLR